MLQRKVVIICGAEYARQTLTNNSPSFYVSYIENQQIKQTHKSKNTGLILVFLDFHGKQNVSRAELLHNDSMGLYSKEPITKFYAHIV